MDSPKDDRPYDDYHDYDPDGDVRRHLFVPNDSGLPPVTFPAGYTDPNVVLRTPPDSSVNEQEEPLGESSTRLDIEVDDIMDFGAEGGEVMGESSERIEGGEVAMGEASAVAEPGALQFRPVQYFYLLDCHDCSRGNELNEYRNGIYNIRLFLHAQNGNFHHLLFFIEHTHDETDTAYEAFYFGFEGQNMETINRALEQYGLQLNNDAAINLLNNNTLFDIYHNIYRSIGNYVPGGANAINHPQASHQSQEEPSSSKGKALAEPDSEGEDSDSGVDTDEDGDDNDSMMMDDDSRLPWTEGPGESSNMEAVINSRLRAARNTRLADGVPPWPTQNMVDKRKKLENLTVYDLAAHFHIQAERATRRMGICQTSLKKQNKRFNVRRWPHRKFKAIDKRIRSLMKQAQKKIDHGMIAEGMRLNTVLDQMRDRRAAMFQDYLTRPTRLYKPEKPKKPRKPRKPKK